MSPLLLVPASIAALVVAGFAGAIAFSSPKPPAAMPAMEEAGKTIGGWIANLPPYRTFTARDGTALAYRFYQGAPAGGVAVLVHGSTGFAASMDGVARELNGKGFSVYALDLRGHGESWPR
jgi:non-heme chloroperoxidase